MFLKYLQIVNYKNLRSARFSFVEGVNTVIGENDSGKSNAMTALRILLDMEAVTVHAAYQYFEETDKGTLAPGKQADLVILDRDPLAVPQEELRDIRVLETWKDGVPIFCREA